MNGWFNKEVRDALSHGVLAGVLVIVLNSIGYHMFDTPEMPFAYGLAAAVAAVVAGIHLVAHRHHDPHNGF